MALITAQQLRQIAPVLTPDRAEILADLHNELCPKYGMDTTDEFEEFLANVIVESGSFAKRSENMNYSAQRMAEVWPGRYSATKTKPYLPNDRAKKLDRNPVAIANDTYGGRNGNTQPNDGWNLRGGGFIQLTGRIIYQAYTDYVNKRDKTNLTIEQLAARVRNDDRWALDSALWCFCIYKGLLDEAVRDEVIAIRKSINGGTIGLHEVQQALARIKTILK